MGGDEIIHLCSIIFILYSNFHSKNYQDFEGPISDSVSLFYWIAYIMNNYSYYSDQKYSDGNL